MGSFLSHTADPLKAMLLTRGSGAPLPGRACLVLFSDRNLTRYELWWNDKDARLVRRDCQRNLIIMHSSCRIVPIEREKAVHILLASGEHTLHFRALSDTVFCVVLEAARPRMWIFPRSIVSERVDTKYRVHNVAALRAILCRTQET